MPCFKPLSLQYSALTGKRAALSRAGGSCQCRKGAEVLPSAAPAWSNDHFQMLKLQVPAETVWGTSQGSFGINQIQTIQTATFGQFSFFPSVFDPGARYSVDPATPIARLQSNIDCCPPTRRSAEMAAAACEVGSHSASVGTSGSACAGPKVLVFPPRLPFDWLLDCCARMICHRPCVRGQAYMWAAVGWRPGSLRFLAVQECVRVASRSCVL
jgi:hypothetical protein